MLVGSIPTTLTEESEPSRARRRLETGWQPLAVGFECSALRYRKVNRARLGTGLNPVRTARYGERYLRLPPLEGKLAKGRTCLENRVVRKHWGA